MHIFITDTLSIRRSSSFYLLLCLDRLGARFRNYFLSVSHVIELLKEKIQHHSFYLSSTVLLLFEVESSVLQLFKAEYTSDFVWGLPRNPAAVESVRQTVGQIGASELGEVGAVKHKHEASAVVITHQ